MNHATRSLLIGVLAVAASVGSFAQSGPPQTAEPAGSSTPAASGSAPAGPSTGPTAAGPAVSAPHRAAPDVDRLLRRVEALEGRVARRASGAVLVLFGAFCALWAQYTRRNAWLWFALGFILNVVAVPLVLMKNADQMKGIAPTRSRTLRQAAVVGGGVLVMLILWWLDARIGRTG